MKLLKDVVYNVFLIFLSLGLVLATSSDRYVDDNSRSKSVSRYIYGPKNRAEVKLKSGRVLSQEMKKRSYVAIQWPQDSIEDVLDRLCRLSSFSSEEKILSHDQLYEAFNKSDFGGVENFPTFQNMFWNYYDPKSRMHQDTQFTIASAISMFHIPKVLVFGSGLDSSLFCKATIDAHPEGSILFLENDNVWFEETQAALDRISSRCNVIKVVYDTRLYQFLDMIGEHEEMARQVIDQLPLNARENFDVILVDGPTSADYNHPGRMSSLSAAWKLVRKDGNGVVFVDDFDRYVEKIFGRYLFRPLMGKEERVHGWGNILNTGKKKFIDLFETALFANRVLQYCSVFYQTRGI